MWRWGLPLLPTRKSPRECYHQGYAQNNPRVTFLPRIESCNLTPKINPGVSDAPKWRKRTSNRDGRGTGPRKILEWNPESGPEPGQKFETRNPGRKIFKPGTQPGFPGWVAKPWKKNQPGVNVWKWRSHNNKPHRSDLGYFCGKIIGVPTHDL